MLAAAAALAWPILILVLVVLGLLMFGLLTLTSSLWTALGIGLAVVGVAQLFRRKAPQVGLVLLTTGLGMSFFHEILPAFTIGEGLTLFGLVTP